MDRGREGASSLVPEGSLDGQSSFSLNVGASRWPQPRAVARKMLLSEPVWQITTNPRSNLEGTFDWIINRRTQCLLSVSELLELRPRIMCADKKRNPVAQERTEVSS